MHTRNAYAALIVAHYPAEKVGAIYNGKSLCPCLAKLRVVVAYRSVIDDCVKAGNVFRFMLGKNGYSSGFQPFRHFRRSAVGAGNRQPFVFARHSQSGHIYPADTYKKQSFYALHCFGNFA